jgi:hypothetical protein
VIARADQYKVITDEDLVAVIQQVRLLLTQ